MMKVGFGLRVSCRLFRGDRLGGAWKLATGNIPCKICTAHILKAPVFAEMMFLMSDIPYIQVNLAQIIPCENRDTVTYLQRARYLP